MRAFALQHRLEIGFLLFGRTEIAEHQHLRKIPHHGAFVLQVIVQAESFRGEMFADDRHGEIADIFAAEFLRQSEAQEAGFVGAAAHFAQQRFPFGPRQSARFEIHRAHSRR